MKKVKIKDMAISNLFTAGQIASITSGVNTIKGLFDGNIDMIVNFGTYLISTTSTGGPVPGGGTLILFEPGTAMNMRVQIFVTSGGDTKTFIRRWTIQGSWTEWREL